MGKFSADRSEANTEETTSSALPLEQGEITTAQTTTAAPPRLSLGSMMMSEQFGQAMNVARTKEDKGADGLLGAIKGTGTGLVKSAEALVSPLLKDQATIDRVAKYGGSGANMRGDSMGASIERTTMSVGEAAGVIWNNPSVLARAGSQFVTNMTTGSMESRFSTGTQGLVLAGTLFMGGAEASRLARLSGDLKAIRGVKYAAALTDDAGQALVRAESAATRVEGLLPKTETVVAKLGRQSDELQNLATRTGDLSSRIGNPVSPLGLMQKEVALTEMSLGATRMQQPGLLARFKNTYASAVDTVSGLVTRTPKTAESVGVGEVSLASRFQPLTTVKNRLLSRFTGGAEETATVATKLEDVTPFTTTARNVVTRTHDDIAREVESFLTRNSGNITKPGLEQELKSVLTAAQSGDQLALATRLKTVSKTFGDDLGDLAPIFKRGADDLDLATGGLTRVDDVHAIATGARHVIARTQEDVAREIDLFLEKNISSLSKNQYDRLKAIATAARSGGDELALARQLNQAAQDMPHTLGDLTKVFTRGADDLKLASASLRRLDDVASTFGQRTTTVLEDAGRVFQMPATRIDDLPAVTTRAQQVITETTDDIAAKVEHFLATKSDLPVAVRNDLEAVVATARSGGDELAFLGQVKSVTAKYGDDLGDLAPVLRKSADDLDVATTVTSARKAITQTQVDLARDVQTFITNNASKLEEPLRKELEAIVTTAGSGADELTLARQLKSVTQKFGDDLGDLAPVLRKGANELDEAVTSLTRVEPLAMAGTKFEHTITAAARDIDEVLTKLPSLPASTRTELEGIQRAIQGGNKSEVVNAVRNSLSKVGDDGASVLQVLKSTDEGSALIQTLKNVDDAAAQLTHASVIKSAAVNFSEATTTLPAVLDDFVRASRPGAPLSQAAAFEVELIQTAIKAGDPAQLAAQIRSSLAKAGDELADIAPALRKVERASTEMANATFLKAAVSDIASHATGLPRQIDDFLAQAGKKVAPEVRESLNSLKVAAQAGDNAAVATQARQLLAKSGDNLGELASPLRQIERAASTVDNISVLRAARTNLDDVVEKTVRHIDEFAADATSVGKLSTRSQEQLAAVKTALQNGDHALAAVNARNLLKSGDDLGALAPTLRRVEHAVVNVDNVSATVNATSRIKDTIASTITHLDDYSAGIASSGKKIDRVVEREIKQIKAIGQTGNDLAMAFQLRTSANAIEQRAPELAITMRQSATRLEGATSEISHLQGVRQAMLKAENGVDNIATVTRRYADDLSRAETTAHPVVQQELTRLNTVLKGGDNAAIAAQARQSALVLEEHAPLVSQALRRSAAQIDNAAEEVAHMQSLRTAVATSQKVGDHVATTLDDFLKAENRMRSDLADLPKVPRALENEINAVMKAAREGDAFALSSQLKTSLPVIEKHAPELAVTLKRSANSLDNAVQEVAFINSTRTAAAKLENVGQKVLSHLDEAKYPELVPQFKQIRHAIEAGDSATAAQTIREALPVISQHSDELAVALQRGARDMDNVVADVKAITSARSAVSRVDDMTVASVKHVDDALAKVTQQTAREELVAIKSVAQTGDSVALSNQIRKSLPVLEEHAPEVANVMRRTAHDIDNLTSEVSHVNALRNVVSRTESIVSNVPSRIDDFLKATSTKPSVALKQHLDDIKVAAREGDEVALAASIRKAEPLLETEAPLLGAQLKQTVRHLDIANMESQAISTVRNLSTRVDDGARAITRSVDDFAAGRGRNIPSEVQPHLEKLQQARALGNEAYAVQAAKTADELSKLTHLGDDVTRLGTALKTHANEVFDHVAVARKAAQDLTEYNIVKVKAGIETMSMRGNLGTQIEHLADLRTSVSTLKVLTRGNDDVIKELTHVGNKLEDLHALAVVSSTPGVVPTTRFQMLNRGIEFVTNSGQVGRTNLFQKAISGDEKAAESLVHYGRTGQLLPPGSVAGLTSENMRLREALERVHSMSRLEAAQRLESGGILGARKYSTWELITDKSLRNEQAFKQLRSDALHGVAGLVLIGLSGRAITRKVGEFYLAEQNEKNEEQALRELFEKKVLEAEMRARRGLETGQQEEEEPDQGPGRKDNQAATVVQSESGRTERVVEQGRQRMADPVVDRNGQQQVVMDQSGRPGPLPDQRQQAGFVAQGGQPQQSLSGQQTDDRAPVVQPAARSQVVQVESQPDNRSAVLRYGDTVIEPRGDLAREYVRTINAVSDPLPDETVSTQAVFSHRDNEARLSPTLAAFAQASRSYVPVEEKSIEELQADERWRKLKQYGSMRGPLRKGADPVVVESTTPVFYQQPPRAHKSGGTNVADGPKKQAADFFVMPNYRNMVNPTDLRANLTGVRANPHAPQTSAIGMPGATKSFQTLIDWSKIPGRHHVVSTDMAARHIYGKYQDMEMSDENDRQGLGSGGSSSAVSVASNDPSNTLLASNLATTQITQSAQDEEA